ncbi:MAG: subtilase family-domain-containing protein [Benjaminiella poitrasii]|nr:MAG: subtilase family-domain-containing protein [Benjaminiella poitrasii]
MRYSSSKPINEYPVHGLMPKQDTQAASFIKKFPNYDGRGTVIAILDTGVDPGAAGMQVTTDGKPKIIDIVDCTGGGDVETTKVVKPTIENGNKVIDGLSGRKLILGDWNNPSDEYRVGLKRAYELFPTELTNRIKSERRENFVKKHAQLLSKAQAELAEFLKDNSKPVEAEKTELEARVEMLKDLYKNYEDPGIIFDCVVFFDGKDWRAVIDVDESGDLRGQPCLADYRKELKYHTFGKADLLNFSVNIYDNGNILSITTLSGSHGTHVAGITAGNFPEEPELNGVAPGAQLISLRIGDSRLGSMETGPGLTRAAAHLAMHKVDLANMSYGESSSLPTDGHFIKLLAEEAIGKSGCIFVTSAGNDGPCFSSIGAPAGMDERFITVGAYVKHAQMQAEYALLESVTERPYTWSSRGPTTDGYHGVDVYAPGSAITSVPVYVLNKLDLKNGTSMSSPNACGCVALLVSALKAEKQNYTPFRLKNAVVQSSKSVDDPLNVGFIQVDKAWEYLESHKDRDDLDLFFKVTVQKRGAQRGIYLRELDDVSKVQYITTKVQPIFMGEEDPENPKYNEAKFKYDARIALVATESWINAPDYLYLHSSGNAFQIKVDPTALSESKFHYGEVLGYDTSAPERGPLFHVPVSVVKPTIPAQGFIQYKNVEYGPGDIIRRFVQVPEGATSCEITIKANAPAETAPARFMLHLLQLVPKQNQKEKHAYSFMLGNDSYGDPESEKQIIKKHVSVRGGLNLEVCLAQFWSGLGKHAIDLSLNFHGVQIAGNLATGHGILHLEPQVTRVDVTSPFRREDKLNLSVSFNKLRKYIRPSEASITPMLPDRDVLPSTRLLYQLILTYNFKIETSTTITARFPTVMNQLYEHFLAGVFGIIYDVNKKIVGYLDVFDHNIKLEQKGNYSIMLQLSVENEDVLEKLKDTILELDMDLKSTTFNTFQKIRDVYTMKSSNYSKIALERKDAKVFYIAAPTGKDALPKEAKAGDALVGTLSFLGKVEGGEYCVLYNVPPLVTESSSNGKSDKKPTDEELEQKLNDATRDLQISYLKKLSADSAAYKSLLSKLDSTFADDITYLEYKMSSIWTASEAKGDINCLLNPKEISDKDLKELIKLADTILEKLNERELLEFYGRKKPDDESDEEKEKRKENDDKKKQIINALKNKGMACAVLLAKKEKDYCDTLNATIRSLQQWNSEDTGNLALLLVKVVRDREAEHCGTALKSVQKYLSEISFTSDTEKDVKKAWDMRNKLYKDLGWSIWAEYDDKWNLIRQPPYGYALF